MRAPRRTVYARACPNPTLPCAAQNYFRAGTRAAEAAKQKGVLALQAERHRRAVEARARQVRPRRA